MQLTTSDKDELRREIQAAFEGVRGPATVNEMLLPLYRSSDDAYMMAAELVGKPWTSIPIERLFYHREMLTTLSAEAYRAYLPAYLEASLATDDPYDKYGADIRQYAVGSLAAFPHQYDKARALVPERLSLLDAGQRAVIARVLAFLETRWDMSDAAEALQMWQAAE